MNNQNEIAISLGDIAETLKEINKTLDNLTSGICIWVDDNRSDGKKIVQALDNLENRFANTHFTEPF